MATDAKMAFPRSDAVRPTKLQGDGDEQHGALVRFFFYCKICSFLIVNVNVNWGIQGIDSMVYRVQTLRPETARVKCGRADLRIFMDLKMTKPNYKPNTDPNSNHNANLHTKQTLILI